MVKKASVFSDEDLNEVIQPQIVHLNSKSNEDERNYRQLNAELATQHANALKVIHALKDKIRQYEDATIERAVAMKEAEERIAQQECEIKRLKLVIEDVAKPILRYYEPPASQSQVDLNVQNETIQNAPLKIVDHDEFAKSDGLAPCVEASQKQPHEIFDSPPPFISHPASALHNISERPEEEECNDIGIEEEAREKTREEEEFDSLCPSDRSDVDTLRPQYLIHTPSVIALLSDTNKEVQENISAQENSTNVRSRISASISSAEQNLELESQDLIPLHNSLLKLRSPSSKHLFPINSSTPKIASRIVTFEDQSAVDSEKPGTTDVDHSQMSPVKVTLQENISRPMAKGKRNITGPTLKQTKTKIGKCAKNSHEIKSSEVKNPTAKKRTLTQASKSTVQVSSSQKKLKTIENDNQDEQQQVASSTAPKRYNLRSR